MLSCFEVIIGLLDVNYYTTMYRDFAHVPPCYPCRCGPATLY
jgi:hypothetical protein